ncbi:DUF2332 domain-containing protein [Microbacterium sp. ET2]|uniref:DUF2332 domain-containing protein n=1 Tax=Microbacterium albipurpureum TaxID=3050384 RepID=UPI00259CAF71|nr:DUF2332 domain-containing protein [Microbacterium sp. ET2 (Ac-2212)]WJL96786.1 DUF2332 domain-containing protein [Microbacterium sp. ET2 (Ac-2212)]
MHAPAPHLDRIAAGYRRFADLEARGTSAIYEEWARAIADDPEILALLAELPRRKQQPHLIFACARLLGAPIGSFPPLRDWMLTNWPRLRREALARATQTNEAGRCAVLLPVLSRLSGPLALIEAGASAGLTLYPDRYSYRYDTGAGIRELHPADGPSNAILECAIDAASVPEKLPRVAWRAGIDLNPLDISDPSALEWLESLIWPEHDHRRRRLDAAAAIAAADPPLLEQGDILELVPDLAARAPRGARVVVYHSSVVMYLDPEGRAAFADLMRSLDHVTWVSNEGSDVFPEITAKAGLDAGGRNILAVNGEPLALVGTHGQSYEAIPGAALRV